MNIPSSQPSVRPLLALLLALFVGCVPSLQPFYTEKDLLFVPALIGSFKETDGNSVWSFAKAADLGYALTISDGEKSSRLSAHLFKFAEQQYLDVQGGGDALQDCSLEDFLRASIIPGHLVLKVAIADSSLKLQVLDEEWLKEQIAAKSLSVPHTFGDEKRLIFTGTTEQMQAFLQNIRDKDAAWGKPAEFKRRK